MHKKVLTGDKLVKRGFHGPFICRFCLSATETEDHLFLNCDFTQAVWNFVLDGLTVAAPSQSAIIPLYASWHERNYVLKGTNSENKKTLANNSQIDLVDNLACLK